MGVYQNVYQDGDHALVTDVLIGTTYANGDLVGTLEDTGDLPIEADVRLNTVYDNTRKTGTLAVPITGAVLLGVATDAVFGTYRPVSVNDVRLTVAFGALDTDIGNLRVPPPEKVEDGYFYDTSDTVEGTLIILSPSYPLESQTLNGINFGDQVESFTGNYIEVSPDNVRENTLFGSISELVGNFTSPPEGQVLDGVKYGTDGLEFTGTLQLSPGIDYPGYNPFS